MIFAVGLKDAVENDVEIVQAGSEEEAVRKWFDGVDPPVVGDVLAVYQCSPPTFFKAAIAWEQQS